MADAMRVHPAAAAFPMLSDDDLADLAEDIKANGLRHPITLDTHGVLIDGRNRLAACNLAGVEPDFETFEGDEDAVIRFILSENVHRRHISKGQLAMGVVIASGFSKTSIRDLGKEHAVSHARIAYASTVVKHAPDLAELVASGAMFLNDAYAEARKRKLAAETQAEADARALRETNAKTSRLREQAPDLADLVAEWRMSLDEAMTVLASRQQDERERRQRVTAGFAKATSYLHALLGPDPTRTARDWQPSENTYASISGCEQLWTSDGLRELAAWLSETADAWEE